MSSLTRILIVFMLVTVCSVGAVAQTPAQESKPATGSITGTVMLGDKPARGVTVMLTAVPAPSQMSVATLFQQTSSVKTTTDENGIYKFTGVAEGRFAIAPYAPALVGAGSSSNETISLKDGEEREDVDFKLVRGGVITGRITHADGRPVVAETVKVARVDSGDKQPTATGTDISAMILGDSKFATDDRGIYRIYGLPAGRYLVSFGQATSAPGQMGLARTRYVNETFHPGFTEKDKATIVELAEGGEATGVDIKLGLPSKTFKASGRIVDANTGKPIAGAVANYGSSPGGSDVDSATTVDASGVNMMSLGSIANSKGEFRFDSLVPGRYGAYATFDQNSDFYSDVTQFEVKDADITSIEVKVRRGLSVGGVVTIEGTDDAAILSSLSELQLFGMVTDQKNAAPRMLTSRIGGDGSFTFRGIQPGKLRIEINRFFTPTKLGVLRIERNGAAQPGGVVSVQNESVNDVRVVLAFAGGVLRGQINIINGKLPDGVRLEVEANLASSFTSQDQDAEVGADGRFQFDSLLPGNYELVLKVEGMEDSLEPIRQNVLVQNGAEAYVTFTLDLKQKKDGNR